MATPHVAGAAATLISAGVDSRDVRSVLIESAEGYDGEWDTKYGYGKLDLEKALNHAVQPTLPDTTMYVLLLFAALFAFVVMKTAEFTPKSMILPLSATIFTVWSYSQLVYVPTLLTTMFVISLAFFSSPIATMRKIMIGASSALSIALLHLTVQDISTFHFFTAWYHGLQLVPLVFMTLSLAGIHTKK